MSGTISLAKDLENSMRMYTMETILDRALPDVRDGLKPVHRRILYAMFSDLHLYHNKPHRKSARVVGEVLGKYHPHGDSSVYGAMVRMAQDFSMRAPLVDGQGNFGSIDGDGAAAMRYTESRMTEMAELLLQDIDAETVGWQPNFDDSMNEPTVLPTMVPNLLLNGSSGIAVGMATNIPPHNLGELCDAITHIGSNWRGRAKLTVDDLMKIVQGPDFPTGGIVFRFRENGDGNHDVIKDMYETGSGKLIMQAGVDIEPQGGGKSLIVITELPFAVQKSTVMERIGKEVRDGRIEGVSDVRDESDFEGMRMIIETSRGHQPEKVLEQLLQYTQLRDTFGANMLALIPDGEGMKPEYLGLKDALIHFINHRLDVIKKRSIFERKKREARLHIVEGLLIALDAIDEVIQTIKKSRSKDTARQNLRKAFKLSEAQAAAIVALPLGNLANLEVKKLRDEAKVLKQRIRELKKLIEQEKARIAMMIDETSDIKERFATPRRTRILSDEETVGQAVTAADLEGPQIVTLSSDRIEAKDADGYRDGSKPGLTTRRSPTVLWRGRVDSTQRVLLVTADGMCWHAPLNKLDGNVVGKKTIVVGGGVISSEEQMVTVITKGGKIKRTKVDDLPRPGSWARLAGLLGGDSVLAAGVEDGESQVMIFTRKGQALRFKASTANPQASSTAKGVAAMKVKAGDEIIAAHILSPAEVTHVAIVSEQGWVKKVDLDMYPTQGRGNQGVVTLNTTKATGEVAAAAVVGKRDNYLDLTNDEGKRFRIKLADVPESNRPNRGEQIATDAGKVVQASSNSSTYRA